MDLLTDEKNSSKSSNAVSFSTGKVKALFSSRNSDSKQPVTFSVKAFIAFSEFTSNAPEINSFAGLERYKVRYSRRNS